jgi:hypothetical protein
MRLFVPMMDSVHVRFEQQPKFRFAWIEERMTRQALSVLGSV